MEDLLYKVGLTMIPQVGAITAKKLVHLCGGAKEVFEAKKRTLQQIPKISEMTVQIILEKKVLKQAEAEIRFMEQNDIQAFFFQDKNYPSRLRHYHDAPVLLYYRGNADLNPLRSVAIVGTRKPSPYGLQLCEEIVNDLSQYGVTVISGLAFGIDITAHRKCLECQIPTVGVLGHGLRLIYPGQHHNIGLKMLENGGLLTEFSSQTTPEREHFPMRNRIIAGLCDALIVVETAQKGGSMISARLANDYNKDVFAVPGRVKDPFAKGCNLLIKSHRAALLESVEDLAYVMRWRLMDQERQQIQKQLFIELSQEEKIIVDLLRQNEALDIDSLTYNCKKSNSEMANLLLNLEFKGMVKSLPGKRYILI